MKIYLYYYRESIFIGKEDIDEDGNSILTDSYQLFLMHGQHERGITTLPHLMKLGTTYIHDNDGILVELSITSPIYEVYLQQSSGIQLAKTTH